MQSLVIIGAGENAELCWHYFTRHTAYKVDGFAVDEEYLQATSLHGLPVLSIADLVDAFPPGTHHAFVAIGYSGGNRHRQAKCEEVRALGYSLASFVHPTAVSEELEMGDNCLVCENAVVQPFARLGSGVFVRTASIIGHHATIGSYAYFAPGVVMSGYCRIGDRVFAGTGSVFRDRLSVADDTRIGMGAVVVKNIETPGLYVGHPAQRVSRGDN
jgi:sugar O-acyltransferase (sialic acid O-acetyltransferase NeuD family)